MRASILIGDENWGIAGITRLYTQKRKEEKGSLIGVEMNELMESILFNEFLLRVREIIRGMREFF